jgi:AcrR family transcriptional regulator
MKKNYHHGDLYNALIESGARIIAGEGSSALTLRKVAALTGVSHAAVYTHFSNKEELLKAIGAFSFSRLEQIIIETAERFKEDPVRCLLEMGWQYVNFAYKKTDLFLCIFSGAPEREKENPDYIDRSRSVFSLICSEVQKCMDEGLTGIHDAKVGASALYSAVHGFAMLNLEEMLPGSIYDNSSRRAVLFEIIGLHFQVDTRQFI